MTKIGAGFAILVGYWLASAWTLMLIVDLIHHRWIPQLPTIGYVFSLGLAALLILRTALLATLIGILRGVTEVKTS